MPAGRVAGRAPTCDEEQVVNKQKVLTVRRRRRQLHVRKKARGSTERPRLSVFRSNKHIGCQIIDDASGRTLVSASTLDKQLREQISKKGGIAGASAVGKAIGERAVAAGVSAVRFDRGHYKYHGRVAALAQAAREAGLSL
jgi:large subunit ribosomal protein L18